MVGDTKTHAAVVMGNNTSEKKSLDIKIAPPAAPVSPAHCIVMANDHTFAANGNTTHNGMTKTTAENINNSSVQSTTITVPAETTTSITPNPDINIPFPKQMHLTLSGAAIERRECVVIGDVHGCLDELQELVAGVRSRAPNCLFIFCGDIVNKGPRSLETLRYVRNMGCGGDAYTVRGNHEDHTLHRWLRWRKHHHDPAKLKKKFRWNMALSDEDAAWLQELPYTISIPHINAVIVHAGLVPGRPLEQQLPWDMTEMRDIVDDGTPSKQRVGTAWASLWPGPQHVYFGHDARRSLQQEPHATGLDTGCVFGGHLTAHFLTGDKAMVRVQAKLAYKKHKTKSDDGGGTATET